MKVNTLNGVYVYILKGEFNHENLEISFWNIINRIKRICIIPISIGWGVANTMSANGEAGGSAGLFVAILLLAGGIVSICVRKSVKKGGNIALVVLFGLAALFGFTGAGSYGDLYIWSFWCLINAVLAVVALVKMKKSLKTA